MRSWRVKELSHVCKVKRKQLIQKAARTTDKVDVYFC